MYRNIDGNYRTPRRIKASRVGIVFTTTAALSMNALAAAEEPQSSTTWTVLILLIVFSATLASAVLNVAAIRQWNRNWGLVSGLPILGLVLWSGIIVSAKLMDPTSHMLWSLEIFAWAMLNMIYMVTVMTAKRVFAKREDENPTA